MPYIRKYQDKEKECLVCKKRFYRPTFPGQKYCSISCQTVANIQGTNPYAGMLPTGTVGEMGELKVAIDLLSKGLEVFKALSPSTSCDIAILKKRKILKTIEVRTGNKNMLKNLESYKKRNVKADILAVVDYESNKIIYYPKNP